MIEFYERMVCQFSLGTTFNENCSCFIYFISLSGGSENQEDFVVTARNKTKFDGPEINIQWNVFNPFFILMIEEHVSFHFQQLSSWINRVLMCYFTFLKVEKSGIFFWKPEIRPTLTAQKKYSKVCLGFNFFSHDEAACQFSFQSLLSTIIHLFDILFDFPGGRKIRKILPGFSRSPAWRPFWN